MLIFQPGWRRKRRTRGKPHGPEGGQREVEGVGDIADGVMAASIPQIDCLWLRPAGDIPVSRQHDLARRGVENRPEKKQLRPSVRRRGLESQHTPTGRHQPAVHPGQAHAHFGGRSPSRVNQAWTRLPLGGEREAATQPILADPAEVDVVAVLHIHGGDEPRVRDGRLGEALRLSDDRPLRVELLRHVREARQLGVAKRQIGMFEIGPQPRDELLELRSIDRRRLRFA